MGSGFGGFRGEASSKSWEVVVVETDPVTIAKSSVWWSSCFPSLPAKIWALDHGSFSPFALSKLVFGMGKFGFGYAWSRPASMSPLWSCSEDEALPLFGFVVFLLWTFSLTFLALVSSASSFIFPSCLGFSHLFPDPIVLLLGIRAWFSLVCVVCFLSLR